MSLYRLQVEDTQDTKNRMFIPWWNIAIQKSANSAMVTIACRKNATLRHHSKTQDQKMQGPQQDLPTSTDIFSRTIRTQLFFVSGGCNHSSWQLLPTNSLPGHCSCALQQSPSHLPPIYSLKAGKIGIKSTYVDLHEDALIWHDVPEMHLGHPAVKKNCHLPADLQPKHPVLALLAGAHSRVVTCDNYSCRQIQHFKHSQSILSQWQVGT